MLLKRYLAPLGIEFPSYHAVQGLVRPFVPFITPFKSRSRSERAAISFKCALELKLEIREVREVHKLLGFLPCKVRGDGAKDESSRNATFQNLSIFTYGVVGFEVLNSDVQHFNSSKFTEVLAALFDKEHYDVWRDFTGPIRQNMDSVVHNGITFEGVNYKFKFLIYGDYKFVSCIFGLQKTTASYPYVHCYTHCSQLCNFFLGRKGKLSRTLKGMMRLGTQQEHITAAAWQNLCPDFYSLSKGNQEAEKTRILHHPKSTCRDSHFSQWRRPLLNIKPMSIPIAPLHMDVFNDFALDLRLFHQKHPVIATRVMVFCM